MKKFSYQFFFSKNEIVFYSNINNLSDIIQKYAKDYKERKLIAKKGKKKYMKFFNSTVVADYIINKTFENNIKKNKYIWDNK